MLDNIWKAYDSSPWQNNFINGIRIHNQSPWFKPMAIYLSKSQFSLAILKPNSHWQHQSPILIGNIKAQFLLAIFKTQFLLAIFKTQFSLAISKPNSRWQYLKPNSHWQYQNPILIGNIKSPILIGNIKSSTYVGTIYRKPKVVNTWQNTIS